MLPGLFYYEILVNQARQGADELRFRVRAQRHEVSPFMDAKHCFARSFVVPARKRKKDIVVEVRTKRYAHNWLEVKHA